MIAAYERASRTRARISWWDSHSEGRKLTSSATVVLVLRAYSNAAMLDENISLVVMQLVSHAKKVASLNHSIRQQSVG